MILLIDTEDEREKRMTQKYCVCCIVRQYQTKRQAKREQVFTKHDEYIYGHEIRQTRKSEKSANDENGQKPRAINVHGVALRMFPVLGHRAWAPGNHPCC